MLKTSIAIKPKQVVCAMAEDGGQWRSAIMPQAPGIVVHIFKEPTTQEISTLQGWERRVRLVHVFASYYWQVVAALRRTSSSILLTCNPRYTFWLQFLCQLAGISVRHIAYSFNFHDLPKGLKRALQTWVFQGIDRFIVHSTFEKNLYSEHFNIPEAKIEIQLWSMHAPNFSPEEPLVSGSYICAIGLNSRDYETLFCAIAKLPHIKLVVVVRPENLCNLEIPTNVHCFQNTSEEVAMNILRFSNFMVLPLRSSQECCGHITVVAAMHFSKAIIATLSIGLDDYLIEGYNAILCSARQPDDMANSIEYLYKNPYYAQMLGRNGFQFAQQNCSVESTRRSLLQTVDSEIIR